jgi:hypothetical protein
MNYYSLFTYHGTQVCYDAPSGNFIHARPGSLHEGALLYWTGGELAILFSNSAGMQLQANEGVWPTAKTFAISSGATPGCHALFDAKTNHYLSAEPIISGGQGNLPVNRVEQDIWESFSCSPAEAQPEADCDLFVVELARLYAGRPPPSDVLAGLSGNPTAPLIAAARAYWTDVVIGAEEGAEAMLQHPATAALMAGPMDFWLSAALPDLAIWLKDRDATEYRRSIGTELDCLAVAAPISLGQSAVGIMRRKIRPRRRACIVATARNEGVYLLEWICYHRSLGFEQFFLYSNNNDDKSDDLLGALADHGIITWIDNRIAAEIPPQFKAYAHAFGFLPDVLDYQWALVIDIDEFLVLDGKRFKTVHEYTEWLELLMPDAVTLNWMMYGTFGQLRFEDRSLVTSQFSQRFPGPDQHIKVMCHPSSFTGSTAHYPTAPKDWHPNFIDSDGEQYNSKAEFAHAIRPVANAAWINHYWSKSIDELLCKFSRNRGDTPNVSSRDIIQIIEDIEHRVLAPERHTSPVIDARIEGYTAQLRQDIEEMLGLPGIRQAADKVISAFVSKINDLRSQLASADVTAVSDAAKHVIDLA